MGYHDIDYTRMNLQAREMLMQAGSTAVWRQFVSAVSGVAVAGQGVTKYYRNSVITGWFGNHVIEQLGERAGAAGMIAGGDLYSVTHERLGRNDELRWNGSLYRVDGESVPTRLASQWVVGLKRTST